GLPDTPGCWLILADAGGIGRSLGIALSQQGHHCFLVHRNPQDAPAATGSELTKCPDFANVERLRSQLEDLQSRTGLPLRAVIHLWNLDPPSDASTWEDRLADAESEGCGVALSLVQALAGKRHEVATRLWFVTRAAQPVGESHRLDLSQSILWGFGKSIALEH